MSSLHKGALHDPWLVRTREPHRRLRLFCFPYAGGNAFNFMPWQAQLEPGIEVCAVQLPGRGSRLAEPPFASVQALLKAVAPVVAAQADLPFAFFGHSLGALIAFELTRYLRLHGLGGPCHLFVSGCQAPRHRSPARGLHRMADAELIQVLRNFESTPPEVLASQELMALVLPTLRADFALAEEYRYRAGPALSVPMSVFAGTRDENKGEGQVDGWADETSGPCEVAWFEGGHFFINHQRDAVLARIGADLARHGITQGEFAA
jgi:medium-chain acyl-[acyl-carrier-protein] hydrolase